MSDTNVAITIITDSGFETVAFPKIMLNSLNNELAKGKTQIHFEERSIWCYGYVIHANGAKNRLAFLGNGEEQS